MASPTPAPPTPGQGNDNWDVELVSDSRYESLSMAIDSAGSAHIVAADRRGIVYWTNEGGLWTGDRIGTPADGNEQDRNPAMAIDEAGQLVVAFERSSCALFGCGGARIYSTTKNSAGWSAPELVGVGILPSAASANGVSGVTYPAIDGFGDTACDYPTPIDYATSSGDGWHVQHVARDGDAPLLALAPDGAPHILFGDPCGSLGTAGEYLATQHQAGGKFSREPIPGTRSGNNLGLAIAVDNVGRTHLLYLDFTDGSADLWFYVVREVGSWSPPTEPLPGRAAQQIAVDSNGHAQVVGGGADGVWYATNATGAWTADQLSEKFGRGAAALALDAAGRPHVLFETGDGESVPFELWYAVPSEP